MAATFLNLEIEHNFVMWPKLNWRDNLKSHRGILNNFLSRNGWNRVMRTWHYVNSEGDKNVLTLKKTFHISRLIRWNLRFLQLYFFIQVTSIVGRMMIFRFSCSFNNEFRLLKKIDCQSNKLPVKNPSASLQALVESYHSLNLGSSRKMFVQKVLKLHPQGGLRSKGKFSINFSIETIFTPFRSCLWGKGK